MTFGEWWGLSKAFAKDKKETMKSLAVAMRVAGTSKKYWEKWLNLMEG